MQKLIFILLICGIKSYSQESEYRFVSELVIKMQYEKLLDTSHLKNWNSIEFEKHIDTYRKRFKNQKENIESDTSSYTNIYYKGKKENVALKVNGKFLNPTTSMNFFDSMSIDNDSIFKIDLGTIPRDSTLLSAELILNDLKRKAKIQLDTKYSLIEIQLNHIESLSEILQREKEEEQFSKELNQSDSLPEPPEFLVIKESEKVVILHLIPQKRKS